MLKDNDWHDVTKNFGMGELRGSGGPYRVGLQAQANFSAPTFEPAHEARAGKRAALS